MENIENKVLLENTTGAAAPEIASTDMNLSVDQMYQQAQLPSLGMSIFSVIPVLGPTAGLFNIRKKAGSNDFELVRSDVEAYPSESIATGITQEAIQDLRSQFGKEANTIVGLLLKGLTNEQENTRTLEFLDAKCKSEPSLTLTAPKNAETNTFEVGQRVHELILRANSKNQRTYDSFAVLPAKVAASFAALNNYVGGMDKDESGLFISEVGNTRFYMNPNPSSTTVYVGLKDKVNPSKSSAVFSPYATTIVEATHKNTGNLQYFIYNRFAITASPLHIPGDEMLFKFDIA